VRRSDFLVGVAAASSLRPETRRLNVVAAPLGHDIDPYRDPERGVDELAWFYADGLMGPKGRPLLAASTPESRDGGRTYRYTLRPTSWHDGAPVTAHDVRSAFAAVSETQWGTHEPYRSVRNIEVLDDRRFDVQLRAPKRDFEQTFFGAFGVPALPLIRHASDGTPVGTGPFAVAARPEANRWVLRRWDGSPRGIPALSEIGVRIMDFAPTRAIQMRTGEAQIALPLAPDAITGPFVTVRRVTSTAVILFNTARMFREASTRRLFARVVDMPALQRRYLNNIGEPFFASLLLGGMNDQMWRNALINESSATLSLRNACGDSPATLTYVAGSPSHERTMTYVQQMLATSGCRSELRPESPARYLSAEGPLRTGAFDLAVMGYAYVDGSDLAADWSCANIPPHGGNFARWCDPETERALGRGNANAVLRRLYDQMVCLPLGVASERVGVSLAVAGVTPPDPLTPFTYRCADWRWA
jgi:ABC-type transport system substrate-binding protein